MKNPLNIAIPVGYLAEALATIQLSVTSTCVDGMYLATLVNNTTGDVTCTVDSIPSSALTQKRGDEHSFGIIGEKPVIVGIDVDRFTSLVMAITVRDGCATALVKVNVRGSLWLNAMYRGDGRHRIVTDKFTQVKKRMAIWRTSPSRLSSALTAKPK